MKWISVDSKLPGSDDFVLTTDSSGQVIIGYYWPYPDTYQIQNGKWYKLDDVNWASEIFVTHWMPLPGPPENN